MKRIFTPRQLEDIKARRQKGETWIKLGKDYNMTPAGLRHHMNAIFGEIKLDPKVCPYCKEPFIPIRGDCHHCGKEDCCLQYRKEHWQRWDRRIRIKTAPKTGEIKVACLGNHCGGQMFRTPAVNDHGRIRPLHRICPYCRGRSHEYCDAFGGC